MFANIKRFFSTPESSKYKTLDDFYQGVDNLINALNERAYHDEAGKLTSLVHEMSWTTSSELIGEVSLALNSMRGKYSKEISEEINECLTFAIHHRKILGLE